MAKRSAKDDILRPVLVYAAAVAVLGVLLGVWQYRYEQSRRPPSAEAIVRNLTETFVGENTVRSVRLEGGAAHLEIAMDGVRALPEDRAQWRQFFRDATDVAADRLFQPPPQIVNPTLAALEQVQIRYTLEGKEVAVGSKRRGDRVATVRMVAP